MNLHTKLIRTTLEHGCKSAEGWDAIAELAKCGESALDAFLLALRKPLQAKLDARDLHDMIHSVYGEFARVNPDALIDRFEAGLIDEYGIYWALGSAAGERSADVLIAGLKSKRKFSRWAAAESLIRQKCKQAVGPLIGALSDRSPLVKSTIVQAMKSNREFRCPEALPALERLIASKSIQKHSPGTYNMAIEVVRMIKNESPSWK